MDKGASNTSENELNPTMGNVLSSSSSKPEDSSESANAPTSDSIPSSSSDANISKGATETGLDDPISSTSDSVYDSHKPVNVLLTASEDTDDDIFANDLNISDVPSEKITENVEDLVSDLETLLEEGSISQVTAGSLNISNTKEVKEVLKPDVALKEDVLPEISNVSEEPGDAQRKSSTESEQAISTSNEVAESSSLPKDNEEEDGKTGDLAVEEIEEEIRKQDRIAESLVDPPEEKVEEKIEEERKDTVIPQDVETSEPLEESIKENVTSELACNVPEESIEATAMEVEEELKMDITKENEPEQSTSIVDEPEKGSSVEGEPDQGCSFEDEPEKGLSIEDKFEKGPSIQEDLPIEDKLRRSPLIEDEPEKSSSIKDEPKESSSMEIEPEKSSSIKDELEKCLPIEDEPEKSPSIEDEPEKSSSIIDEPEESSSMEVEAEKSSSIKDEPENSLPIEDEPEQIPSIEDEYEKSSSIQVEPEKMSLIKDEPEESSLMEVKLEKSSCIKDEPAKSLPIEDEPEKSPSIEDEPEKSSLIEDKSEKSFSIKGDPEKRLPIEDETENNKPEIADNDTKMDEETENVDQEEIKEKLDSTTSIQTAFNDGECKDSTSTIKQVALETQEIENTQDVDTAICSENQVLSPEKDTLPIIPEDDSNNIQEPEEMIEKIQIPDPIEDVNAQTNELMDVSTNMETDELELSQSEPNTELNTEITCVNETAYTVKEPSEAGENTEIEIPMEVEEDNNITLNVAEDNTESLDAEKDELAEPVVDFEIKSQIDTENVEVECKELVSESSVNLEALLQENTSEPEIAKTETQIAVESILSKALQSNIKTADFTPTNPDVDEVIQVPTCSETPKASKVVVEFSVADTTASEITSDCEVPAEKTKVPEQTIKKRKSNLKGERPETELNKVLTIEVEDVPSETYETSNDETLECSSRSDLEDNKPEYSSRISKNEDLKMTITKQKPDEFHSILKIYDPDDTKNSIPKFKIKSSQQEQAETVPKLSIKSLLSSEEQAPSPKKLHSPKTSKTHSPNNQKTSRKSEMLSPLKLTIKPVKADDGQQQRSSPKITIKPIAKPDSEQIESHSKGSPKITIKPILKPEDDLASETVKSSPKITIKPIPKPEDDDGPKTSGNFTIKAIDDADRASPKIIIKPVVESISESKISKFSTRSSSDNSQSSPKITIKPIQKPDDDEDSPRNSPKITIKPVVKSDDDAIYESAQCSPKITIKPIFRTDEDKVEHSRYSPKVTIKHITKGEDDVEYLYSPKITIKPIIKPDDDDGMEPSTSSPKIIIKPILKTDDSHQDVKQHSPKVTIKSIPKPADIELLTSPRITIKPIVKPEESEYLDEVVHSPKITIKPIPKPQDTIEAGHSPRITIKPIIKPQDEELESTRSKSKKNLEAMEDISFECDDTTTSKQERIVLKIQKNTIPTPTSSRKREYVDDEEKSEKLGKIKLKFSKQGGRAEIVSNKKFEEEMRKKEDMDVVEITQISSNEEVKKQPPPSINEVIVSQCKEDPLDNIPVFEITPDSVVTMKCVPDTPPTAPVPLTPTPRKRGRPRKVPLEVREEFKDETQVVPPPVVEESTRPKRSCRGPSVRTTLGIKPRKPRGPGRGRGGKRGTGTGRVGRPPGRPKLSATKLKLLKETVSKTLTELKDAEVSETKPKLTEDVVMIEEETRMSAETSTSSRAQTPAKQIQTGIVPEVEESQSSVLSTATTESAKARKSGLPRLEVYQEPEGAVISADQLAEYYWGGGGPYMLQEQVAQFLGIKSFKRKYPGIKRRPVEMQERDFIREQGLASEAMCDLGLTAVNSSDILDIMYSDFQNKYEEYCKHQRDRQVKDFSNKQRALSLAASQEKNTIAQQAVQSAASWNSSFNKSRREERKACMDLQTFTVHYPRGRMKQMSKAPMGNYPLALVPGQFTDYYKTFTPSELTTLPLNTVRYDAIPVPNEIEDSQSDCSGSESDTSSSDTYSSSSDSSDEDCNMCTPPATPKNILAH